MEQLYAEAEQRAGSPEGLLCLVHLLLAEADKIVDWNTEEAAKIYRMLLHTYVLAKRKAAYYRHQHDCDGLSILAVQYQSIQNLVKARRNEARAYAKEMNPDKVWGIKQEVGRSVSLARPKVISPLDPIRIRYIQEALAGSQHR